MSRYLTKVALAIKGERVEKGTEIDLTDAEAANIDSADLAPVGVAVEEPEVAEAPVSIEDMSYEQLKAKAKEFGLSSSGSKADLTERIELHLAGNADDESDEDGQGEGENADDTSDEDGQGEVTSD